MLQSLALPSSLTVAHSPPPASTEKVSTTQDYWVFESLLRIYGIFTSGQSVWNSYYSPTDSWLVYWLCVYQCYTYLSLCTSLLASWWRLYGSLAEDSAPIVSNLITSDCIVKPYCVKSATYFKGFDYRVCPTMARFGGDIDSTSSIVRAKKRIGSPSTKRLYYSQPTRRLPCTFDPVPKLPTLPLSHPPLSIRGTGGGWAAMLTQL